MAYSIVTTRRRALLRAAFAFAACMFAMQTTPAMTEADPKKIFPDPKAAALADAAAEGDAAKVKSLVAAGADPNAHGERGVTLLEWSMLRQSPKGLAALLESGANASEPGVGGATPLHIAAMANDPEYLRILLDHGADPNAPHGATGEPPLSASLMNPDGRAFDLLLQHRADPNRADRLGNTPLFVAAKTHKPDAVLRLLEAGADASRRNERGDTFQAYFNIAPAGGFSGDAQKKHDAVSGWLTAHGVAVEAAR
jgi:ankyrin repeat protein